MFTKGQTEYRDSYWPLDLSGNCCIGNVYQLFGDQVGIARDRAYTIRQYTTAIAWVERCNAFSEKAGIAYDTSEADILLSALYLKIGNKEIALTYAQKAKDMALSAGNKRDIADSYKMLIEIYSNIGKNDLVNLMINECKEHIAGTEFLQTFLNEVEDVD